MIPKNRKSRGFSLLEVMIAGSVFLIGIMSVTALVMMSSQRRGRASKGAAMSRIVTEEYNRLSRRGYDNLVVGDIAASTVLDPDGRRVTVSGVVGNDCNATVGDAGTNLSGPDGGLRPDASQACCPGSICCKVVRLDALWDDTSQPGSPPISESYIGFVTKSCQ
jgi:hypothetical protein